MIEKAYDTLEAHNWTREELQSYDRSDKAYYDTLAREQYVREEGEATGKVEGKAEGVADTQIEIAQRLLKLNIDSSIIASATHLTLEQIEKIKKS